MTGTPYKPYPWLDTIIGLVYLACFQWGTVTNLVSLYYFVKQRFKKKDITSQLYTLTALQDFIISLLSLNHGMNLLRDRIVWLGRICAAHHILFQMSQRMSVFLVAFLSITRTYTLCYPLRTLNNKKILISLAVLWCLMACFFIIPPIAGMVQITYHPEGGYCWAEPIPGKNITRKWDEMDNTMDTIGLACPVIPVTISTIISSYKIMRTTKSSSQAEIPEEMVRLSRKMTCTIIFVTILYIISNIPLFVNYGLYVITIYSFTYPGPIYDSVLMYSYSWNVTALLSTALNASANPVVYYIRMDKFRGWLRGGCGNADLGPGGAESRCSATNNSKDRTSKDRTSKDKASKDRTRLVVLNTSTPANSSTTKA